MTTRVNLGTKYSSYYGSNRVDRTRNRSRGDFCSCQRREECPKSCLQRASLHGRHIRQFP